MQSPELKSLLQQYLAGTISGEDFARLWKSLDNSANDSGWLSTIEEALNTNVPLAHTDSSQAQQALEMIKAKIIKEQYSRSRIYHMSGARLVKYASAVIIILSIAIFAKIKIDKKELSPAIAATANKPQDVEPGGQKAILTLSDGSKIILDNANNGTIAQQGQVQVIKLDNGQIQYRAVSKKHGNEHEVAFNTMATPRGGQYQLLLPDGSKVWLNSESSITYPIAFAENERRVKITGEAYFEVAKDKRKPFRVETGDMQVEVLGTHFNVKAYADDGPTKTSLLEGSVRIDSQILKPGQAFMNGRIVRTNVDQDVAWKNGIFNFNNESLSRVMKQLARWYDLEVIYPDGIPKKEYGGEIGRNLKLNQVLKGLENSGIHFELDGKRVTVSIKK